MNDADTLKDWLEANGYGYGIRTYGALPTEVAIFKRNTRRVIGKRLFPVTEPMGDMIWKAMKDAGIDAEFEKARPAPAPSKPTRPGYWIFRDESLKRTEVRQVYSDRKKGLVYFPRPLDERASVDDLPLGCEWRGGVILPEL